MWQNLSEWYTHKLAFASHRPTLPNRLYAASHSIFVDSKNIIWWFYFMFLLIGGTTRHNDRNEIESHTHTHNTLIDLMALFGLYADVPLNVSRLSKTCEMCVCWIFGLSSHTDTGDYSVVVELRCQNGPASQRTFFFCLLVFSYFWSNPNKRHTKQKHQLWWHIYFRWRWFYAVIILLLLSFVTQFYFCISVGSETNRAVHWRCGLQPSCACNHVAQCEPSLSTSVALISKGSTYSMQMAKQHFRVT